MQIPIVNPIIPELANLAYVGMGVTLFVAIASNRFDDWRPAGAPAFVRHTAPWRYDGRTNEAHCHDRIAYSAC